MVAVGGNHHAWFQRLDALLSDFAGLWQPQPFRQARPDWCITLPALADTVLALSDETVAALADDHAALIDMIARHVPALAELESLCRLPECSRTVLRDTGPHLVWDIPGRKWDQITAFAGAMGEAQAPLLEWCGGKGHLGRLLGALSGRDVLTLERNDALCAAGSRLARRARVQQRFQVSDVLAPDADGDVAGRHAVALHACGELHRQLVRRAVAANVPALDIAPCCYHLGLAAEYRPYSSVARLRPGRDDLRLAVTEGVTASRRELARRDRAMAWKLGFDILRRSLPGQDCYRPFRPVPPAWLGRGFAGYCQALATREGLTLPMAVDWDAIEAQGWQRQRDTMRLSLVRQAFRRPLELWLVLDLACYLERHGYAVRLGSFCPRRVTPRNILLSARRA